MASAELLHVLSLRTLIFSFKKRKKKKGKCDELPYSAIFTSLHTFAITACSARKMKASSTAWLRHVPKHPSAPHRTPCPQPRTKMGFWVSPYVSGCTQLHTRWVSFTVSNSVTQLIHPWHKSMAHKSMPFLTSLWHSCLRHYPILEIIPLWNPLISKLWVAIRMLTTLFLFIDIYSL